MNLMHKVTKQVTNTKRWSIKILAKCMSALNFCQWQIF